jgi:hypothetical protein
VLFEGFLPPVFDGFRSLGKQTSHLLYRADSCQFDVQIEAIPEMNRLGVTGQLLDASDPAIVGRNMQVTLSDRRGNRVQVVTNEFGEFHGEIENSGDLELSFMGRAGKSIIISLRNALGQLGD